MKGANGQLPKLRPDVRLYLFHGADDAGAADLARRLADTMPDAERVDIDGGALKRLPGRLADEAAAMSLFGDTRLIRVSLGEDALEAVQLLLDAERAGNPVIAVAPGIKGSGKLANLASGHAGALAVACYAPSAGELEKIVMTALGEHGLRPARGLAHRIAEAAAGDRAVIAREVEKLALYLDAAPDRPRDVEADHLDAIGADDGESAQVAAVDALIDARPGDAGLALVHLDAGGASPVSWLRAVQRRLVTLGDMRVAVDKGEPPEAVVKRHRVHFREEARTLRDLRRWTPRRIAAALDRVRAAETGAMAANNPGPVAAEQMAVSLARGLAEAR